MKKREQYLAFGTPDFTQAEIDAVVRVMQSGWIGMGPETVAFEQDLAAYIGAPEVVTVNSCTSALFLALLAEGIGVGDEVIVPSLTWCATANAALYLGATPVFCDVDPYTMSATAETVLAQVTPKTRAVIVVHYGGYAIDMNAIRKYLPEHIVIIEDAAHALGARYPDGLRVGASGNPVCFSFYANKNLSTAEGGAIALFDSEKANHLRGLRMSGMESNAWLRFIKPSVAIVPGISELGYKMNFTDLQAAIGRVQLSRLDTMAAKRLELARHYHEQMRKEMPEICFQAGCMDENHARHLLVACFDPVYTGMKRNDLLLALRDRNIGASIHYQPLHTMPLYASYARGSLPETERLAGNIMTLPISARMTIDDVDYVLSNLSELIKRKSRNHD